MSSHTDEQCSIPTSRHRKIDLRLYKSVYVNWTFSTYVRAGDFIFVNFQSANPAGTIEKQTEECFHNLTQTLEVAGTTLDDVVKITVLIKNPDEFQRLSGADNGDSGRIPRRGQSHPDRCRRL